MDDHGSCLLGDGFPWAPRSTVKIDGFEGFSNIMHTDRCGI